MKEDAGKPLWRKALDEAKRQPNPRKWLEGTRADVQKGRLSAEELDEVLTNIEKREERRYELFPRSEIQTPPEGKEDWRGASLVNRFFRRGIDLSGVDFYGSNLESTGFDRVNLAKAKFSRIVIGKEWVDLDSGRLDMPDASPWSLEPLGRYVDSCSDCERYNNRVMDRKSPGIFLYWGGHPVGYLKLKGERSFLALRTVTTSEGALFWKGMVYALSENLTAWLERQARSLDNGKGTEEKTWYAADVEDIMEHYAPPKGHLQHAPLLMRNNLRFLSEPYLFERLDRLRERLEAGAEPLVGLRLGNNGFFVRLRKAVGL